MNDDISPALEVYEAYASIYDDFNHRNDYETWIGAVLLPRLIAHGLQAPGAALDVGCGTGRAFPPLLKRGWDICGCDVSPAMVKVAEERFGDQVRLGVADMRRLPTLGSFDLVLAVNDAVNHLLSDRDLGQTMGGFAKNLAPGGLLVFDCNARALFDELFRADVRHLVEHGGRRWTWRGMGEDDRLPSVFRASISGDSIEPITISERHFSRREVETALEDADLRCRAVFGQREVDGEVLLSEEPDEERDAKFVYFASRES
jgi:SAM-dependent methyltransferase